MNFISKFFLERELRKQTPSDDGGVHFLPVASRYSRSLMSDPTTAVYANEAYNRNSIVFDCVGIRVDGLQAAPFKVVDAISGDLRSESSLAQIMRFPNPVLDEDGLKLYIETYTCIGGNTYIHKVRDGYGALTELYPYHASQITPIVGTNWITKYRYNSDSEYTLEIPPNDIIHLKWNSVDFKRPWLAVPPLMSLAKEVDIDNETMELEISIVLNNAVIPFAIIPGENVNGGIALTDDQISRQLEKLKIRTGGKNTGNGLILNSGSDIKQLGISPKDMGNLTSHQIPETRIPAVFKVPLTKTSFYTSLQNSTMNNRESDELTFARTMIAQMGKYAKGLTQGIKNEVFADGTKGSDYRIEFDITKIPALMEQQWQKRKQTADEWNKNIITQNEARKELGLEPAQNGDLYFYELVPYKVKEPSITD